jgi:hypothetical protein
VLAGFPGEHVEDVAQSDATESEVAPLVASPDERAGKTGDDHNPINQDDVEDRRPGHASGEEQVGEQERSSNEPVDVTNCRSNISIVHENFDNIATYHRRSRGKRQTP